MRLVLCQQAIDAGGLIGETYLFYEGQMGKGLTCEYHVWKHFSNATLQQVKKNYEEQCFHSKPPDSKPHYK